MEEIYRSQFRLPYSLYERLKKSADTNRRSVNAELVARLEAALDQDCDWPAMTAGTIGNDQLSELEDVRRTLLRAISLMDKIESQRKK